MEYKNIELFHSWTLLHVSYWKAKVRVIYGNINVYLHGQFIRELVHCMDIQLAKVNSLLSL